VQVDGETVTLGDHAERWFDHATRKVYAGDVVELLEYPHDGCVYAVIQTRVKICLRTRRPD
jgi:hypothetical protein